MVAAVQNGYEAVMKTVLCQPDVILMDIEMETRTAGLDAASQILSQYPQVKIIILTSYEMMITYSRPLSWEYPIMC